MNLRTVVAVVVAFVLGVIAGGVRSGEDARGSVASENDVAAKRPKALERTANSVSEAVEAEVSAKGANPEREAATGREVSAVEVMVDATPVSEPGISAAHAARQARRQAAREAREKNRRDFLAELNLELLSDRQRETHQLFLEALAVRDETAAEIRRRRAAGEDVPSDLQSRLSDAQSVLRADHDAECRALREAAARAAGMDEKTVRQLIEDLDSIDQVLPR